MPQSASGTRGVSSRADVAVMVADAWHHRGIGRRLLEPLRERAVQRGFRRCVPTYYRLTMPRCDGQIEPKRC